MITDFSNITSALVKLALDAHTLQHNAIATNIANANTQNYHTSTVDFQKVYDDMNVLYTNDDFRSQSGNMKSSINSGDYLQVSNKQGVEVDQELVGLSENTVKYKTLLSALASRGEIMQIAIKGDKR